MTREEAQWFLDKGRADLGPGGWYIAHQVGNDLEWFRVTEQDAAHFDFLTSLGPGNVA